jgi:hypothetical protein
MHYKPSRPRPPGASADPFANIVEHRETGAAQRQPPSPYDRVLNRSTVTWLHELPNEVRPREAALRFQRILNRLSRYWDSPRMLDDIFAELLVDKRAGRKGFPPEILAEIRALYAHFKSLHPETTSDLWASVPDRHRKVRVRF